MRRLARFPADGRKKVPALCGRGRDARVHLAKEGKCRSIEIGDVSRILKRMRARGEITNRCLRVMSKWGMLGTPPYYDGRAKRSEIRLWEYGIGIFDFYLKTKGIL